jgi:hypothetical protein
MVHAARCSECRAGEHDDYDVIVGLCVVKDPDTGKVVLRAYLCASHVEMRVGDGYEVYKDGRRIQ